MKSSWTPELTEKLSELHSKGLSATIMGRLLKFTRNAVLGKIHRMGLSCPRANPYDRYPDKPKKLAGEPSRPRARERASVPPVAASPAPTDTPVHERLSIMQLTEGVCRYPLGDPGTATFGFCGRETRDRSVYCENHAVLCSYPSTYIPRTPTPEA